jgi:hypothetical protein
LLGTFFPSQTHFATLGSNSKDLNCVFLVFSETHFSTKLFSLAQSITVGISKTSIESVIFKSFNKSKIISSTVRTTKVFFQ